jgi:hypothetical protein
MNWKNGPNALPIASKAQRVLEIGSGARPHPRATVLMDRFLSDEHREGRELVRDHRPFVLADAAALPFRRDAFDYILAFHVLEHVPAAPKMLEEMMRVGRAGTIETPTSLHDFLFATPPYPEIHLWWVDFIEEEGGQGFLRLQKKSPAMATQPFGPFLDQLRRQDPYLEAWIEQRPRLFLTQYHWVEKIRYQVIDYQRAPLGPAVLPECALSDRRLRKAGFFWGTGLWGWKRWIYSIFIHPVWRKSAQRIFGYLRSRP